MLHQVILTSLLMKKHICDSLAEFSESGSEAKLDPDPKCEDLSVKERLARH